MLRDALALGADPFWMRSGSASGVAEASWSTPGGKGKRLNPDKLSTSTSRLAPRCSETATAKRADRDSDPAKLALAQLDPSDLPGQRLGQVVHELDPARVGVGAEVGADD
jgi:hypothetical protein